MKKGTAASDGLLTPSSTCCGMMYMESENSLVAKVNITAAPMAMDTGTLSRMSTINPMNRTTNMAQLSGSVACDGIGSGRPPSAFRISRAAFRNTNAQETANGMESV